MLLFQFFFFFLQEQDNPERLGKGLNFLEIRFYLSVDS